MAYVLIADLDMPYIQTLIQRCGFTDVTDQYPPSVYYELIAIQDLDGNVSFLNDLDSTRKMLINAYVLQQNS